MRAVALVLRLSTAGCGIKQALCVTKPLRANIKACAVITSLPQQQPGYSHKTPTRFTSWRTLLLWLLLAQVVAELGKENEGLVHPAPVSGAAVSGLVLLLQALRLQGLLSVQQEQLLRLLAWQRDGRLMRVWDAVSACVSGSDSCGVMAGAAG